MKGIFLIANAIFFVMVLTSCSSPRAPLNPPRLVTDSQSDMAIPLFMQATLLMAKYYGYQTISYGELREKIELSSAGGLPFMPPETVRAAPPLIGIYPADAVDIDPEDTNVEHFRKKIKDKLGYNGLVRYYITTGWQAAKIICRNYMTRLDEHSQYLDFLRKEFGFANSLATGILLAVDANGALTNAFSLSKIFGDSSIDAYQEYRFLNLVDRNAALVLVSAAQDAYAKHFLKLLSDQPGKGGESSRDSAANNFFTFSEALNAVNTIEYQCTREGIRNLVTRAVNITPTNISINDKTGALVFNSAAADAAKATGKQ